MPSRPTKSVPWWGTVEVPLDSCACWQIGPLTLWIARHAEYWTTVRNRAEDPFQARAAVTIPSRCPEERVDEVARFGAAGESGQLTVKPVHADRPVVITPESPFTLPPKRRIHLYVSLPLWYQVQDGSPGAVILDEAIVQPSDTWHGPNTRIGQLCYASRTRAGVVLMDRLPHRVIAPLEVRNDSGTELKVERVKVPTPHLSVFADEHGELWTESIVFQKEDSEAQADIRIEPDSRPAGRTMELLSGPRMRAEKKFAWHAFGEIFGTGW